MMALRVQNGTGSRHGIAVSDRPDGPAVSRPDEFARNTTGSIDTFGRAGLAPGPSLKDISIKHGGGRDSFRFGSMPAAGI